METPAAQTTESAPVMPDFETYEREANAKDIGKPLPENQAPPKQESAPAPKAETQPSDAGEKPAEASPDSETGSTADQKPRSNAETRVQQLLRERHELRQRIAAMERPPQTQVAKVEKPKLPVLDDYNSLGEYNKALTEYDAKNEEYFKQLAKQTFEEDQRQKQQQYQQTLIQQHNRAVEEGWGAKQEEAIKRHADYEDAVKNPEVLALMEAAPAMDSFLLDSEIGADMLYHLATNSDDAKRIAKLSPWNQARELVKLEAKVFEQIKASGPKKVTSAPPPERQLSGSRSSPSDRVASALSNNDFAAYEREQNQRDIAARRR